MGTAYLRYLNLLFSAFYAVLNIILFITLQALAVVSPFLLGVVMFGGAVTLWEEISSSKIPPAMGVFLLGGGLASLLTGKHMLIALVRAFVTPQESGVLADARVISLVDEVTKKVGGAPFRAVYLNPGLDISTFYTSRGRYLALSVLALKYLTVEELKAVIAHECAHHHHHAMLLNRVHYRAIICLYSYCNAMQNVVSALQRKSQSDNTVQIGQITLIIVLLYMFLYKGFLRMMAYIIRDADYEYYCDSVAIKLAGGNIFASALQKIFDLRLADHIIRQEILSEDSLANALVTDNQNEKGLASALEQNALDRLDQKYNSLRYNNPSIREENARVKSDTHPPVFLRLQKARYGIMRSDHSTPLLTDTEARDQWSMMRDRYV